MTIPEFDVHLYGSNEMRERRLKENSTRAYKLRCGQCRKEHVAKSKMKKYCDNCKPPAAPRKSRAKPKGAAKVVEHARPVTPAVAFTEYAAKRAVVSVVPRAPTMISLRRKFPNRVKLKREVARLEKVWGVPIR